VGWALKVARMLANRCAVEETAVAVAAHSFSEDPLAAIDAFPVSECRESLLRHAESFAIPELGEWAKPLLTLFGAQGPVTKGGEMRIIEHVPGAKGQPHHVLPDANHFLQEDVAGELVERTLDPPSERVQSAR